MFLLESGSFLPNYLLAFVTSVSSRRFKIYECEAVPVSSLVKVFLSLLSCIAEGSIACSSRGQFSNTDQKAFKKPYIFDLKLYFYEFFPKETKTYSFKMLLRAKIGIMQNVLYQGSRIE